MHYNEAIPIMQDLVKTYQIYGAPEAVMNEALARLQFLIEQQKKEQNEINT